MRQRKQNIKEEDPKSLLGEQLSVLCNMIERKIIELKARGHNLSVSEFLRTIALKGQVDSQNTTAGVIRKPLAQDIKNYLQRSGK